MFKAIAQFFLGKEAAIALSFIKHIYLIFDSIREGKNPSVAPFAKELFVYLPADFKAPYGPATQQEFVDAVYNVFALFVRSKA